MSGASETSEKGSTGLVPNQLAMLVPSFDPSKDDIEDYTTKVELLLEAWPSDKYMELATRLILNTSGTAFKKLQLHRTDLLKGTRSSIEKLVSILGGQWGRVNVEKRYEIAEKALFRCQQRVDESSDSYLARADVLWTELLLKHPRLEDLQAYIILRGSLLNSEDKKKVLMDTDAANSGNLSMAAVTAAIRTLGAGFFQEMLGAKNQSSKQKIYDAKAFVAEQPTDEEMEMGDAMVSEEVLTGDFIEALQADGDEDAVLVAQFENATMDAIQEDEELASCYTAYQEARRRLQERFRHRGFWPSTKGGKGKGSKGKGKGFQRSGKGQSLQNRILNSTCRLCGERGHWKAECPRRHAMSSREPSTSASSVTSMPTAHTTTTDDPSGLMMEFYGLKELPEMTLDVTRRIEQCFVSCWGKNNLTSRALMILSNRVNESKREAGLTALSVRSDTEAVSERQPREIKPVPSMETPDRAPGTETDDSTDVFFASHGTYGVVDLGATKTVIGSRLVKELLDALDPEIRAHAARCSCQVTFRFGNQGMLTSQQALILPIGDLRLKIAIVDGGTPLLLSNTLLRALGSTIDTMRHELTCKRLGKTIPLSLTKNGLFLLDLNQVCSVPRAREQIECTFMTDSRKEQVRVAEPQSTCEETSEGERDVGSSPSDFSGLPLPTDHVVQGNPSSPTSGDSDGARGASSTSDALLPGRAVEDDRELRGEVERLDVSTGVGERPGLHQLVPGKVWGLTQDGAPPPADLHRVHGGSCRAAGTDSPKDDAQEGDTLHSTGGIEFRGRDGAEASFEDCREVQAGHPPNSARDQGGDECVGRCGVERPNGRAEQPRGELRAPAGCHQQPARSHDPDGERAVGGGEAFASTDGGREPLHGTPLSLLVESDLRNLAGCVDEETDVIGNAIDEIQQSRELVGLRKWIRCLREELHKAVKSNKGQREPRRCWILEVFCSNESQLTRQGQRLGVPCERFGLSQGDLSTQEGRQAFFKRLVLGRPHHVWFSPECSPWCAWNRLNAGKSLTQLKSVQDKRLESLYQVALGVILFEWQTLQGGQFHWEQPAGSAMWHLAPLHAILAQTFHAHFDMCRMGELRDPASGAHLRKPMSVLTTSEPLFQTLHQKRCQDDHEHIPIAGSTQTPLGPMNLSTWSSLYTRKFARQVVQTLAGPRERRKVATAILAARGREFETTGQGAQKRQRLLVPVPECGSLAELPEVKRRRLDHKQPSPGGIETWHQLLQRLETQIPRVGKAVIADVELDQLIQRTFPGMRSVEVVGCRGTNRTLPPSQTLRQVTEFV